MAKGRKELVILLFEYLFGKEIVKTRELYRTGERQRATAKWQHQLRREKNEDRF
jgi:hypothetical protein